MMTMTMTNAMWPSASENPERLTKEPFRDLDFVIIGSPGSERVERFQRALSQSNACSARFVSYHDLLEGRVSLTDLINPSTLLRLESPDRDSRLLCAFLEIGAEIVDEVGDFKRLSRRALSDRPLDPQRILYPRQWYLGFREALRRIASMTDDRARWMNSPEVILTMFDKPRCHAVLKSQKIPVPRSLGRISCYEELRERMKRADIYRVFVKLAHGSSASGVAAYQTNGRRSQANAPVEVLHSQSETMLYHSKRVRVYREETEIAILIDELCRHRVHVEEWFPKAGFQGQTFDLRVLSIAGEARHVVVRLNRSPITNLHLASSRVAGRATLEDLLPSLDAKTWESARQTCERIMRIWPEALYAGIDLMIGADNKSHAIAEVNAFGDLLYGALHRGLDPYAAEIQAAIQRNEAANG